LHALSFVRKPALAALPFIALLGGACSAMNPPVNAGSENAAAPQPAAVPAAAPKELFVYTGSYTSGKGKGLHMFRLDLATGKLTPVGAGPDTVSPSFLAFHPNGRFLYAVNEAGGGAVSAFALDRKTGGLRFLNEQSSQGGAPCHITIDRAGRNALVANYTGGNVIVLPINRDGTLAAASDNVKHAGKGVDPRRQEAAHAHSINLDGGNRYAFAADLGLDKVFIYRYDGRRGKLTPNNMPFASIAAGSGPRHFAFHPSGRHAYVINEMALTITAFDYDPAKGHLREFQTLSTVPDGKKPGYSTAEVVVSPDGRFLYGSNRGHNSIAVFSIDEQTGTLTSVQHQSSGGKTPRNFAIDPTGTYLLAANQDSDSVVVFRIDRATGKLSPTGHSVSVPKPVCVRYIDLPEASRR
jgi:6-phosphogluconolactonase